MVIGGKIVNTVHEHLVSPKLLVLVPSGGVRRQGLELLQVLLRLGLQLSVVVLIVHDDTLGLVHFGSLYNANSVYIAREKKKKKKIRSKKNSSDARRRRLMYVCIHCPITSTLRAGSSVSEFENDGRNEYAVLKISSGKNKEENWSTIKTKRNYGARRRRRSSSPHSSGSRLPTGVYARSRGN